MESIDLMTKLHRFALIFSIYFYGLHPWTALLNRRQANSPYHSLQCASTVTLFELCGRRRLSYLLIVFDYHLCIRVCFCSRQQQALRCRHWHMASAECRHCQQRWQQPHMVAINNPWQLQAPCWHKQPTLWTHRRHLCPASYHEVTITTYDNRRRRRQCRRLILTFACLGEFHHLLRHAGGFPRQDLVTQQWHLAAVTVPTPSSVTQIRFVDYETSARFDPWRRHMHSAINRTAVMGVACR